MHYYDYELKRSMKLLIACVKAPAPHTAENVAILFEDLWTNKLGLALDQIFVGITDNATNLIKLFKKDLPQLHAARRATESANAPTDPLVAIECRREPAVEPGDPNLLADDDEEEEEEEVSDFAR